MNVPRWIIALVLLGGLVLATASLTTASAGARGIPPPSPPGPWPNGQSAPTREMAAAVSTPVQAQAPTREFATGALKVKPRAVHHLPPAVRLATLEHYGFIPEASPPVRAADARAVALSRQLNSLAGRCAEDSSRLADLAIATKNTLAKDHQQVTFESILRAVEAAAPQAGHSTFCASYFHRFVRAHADHP
ncbi:MAG: hypothetical protein M1296_06415 [Chloroflexi bacterium]|nr:hypothetical protein [Chloroflexota bacterium]